ncbi:hypothetical protein K504DRAFT_461076 [Pleomassaria siparia CBS 279.74]|uniref:Uncharacterized protein n=1 Tax=Pleomassaria siparia CBS 279.74 TaxID=1314801 RepID=A0A6G1JWF2_9PLEO|nr:hypothetical protein K504DRAFT_461076 [Pleomassaria siparia CBS 279.74]
MPPPEVARTAFSQSSHTTSSEARRRRAGLAETLGTLGLPCGQDMVLLRYQPSNTSILYSRPLFYIPSCRRSRYKYAQLPDTPVAVHREPHQPQTSFKYMDMVATPLHGFQLNFARRILAEIQLRINGFNTYG